MIEVIISGFLCFIPLQREIIPKINPIRQKLSPHKLAKNAYVKAMPIKGIDINKNSKIGVKLKIGAMTARILSFRNFKKPMIIPKITRVGPSTGV